MVASPSVIDHYGTTSLRIDEALRRAGFMDGIIGWADFTPLDQFHEFQVAAVLCLTRISPSGASGRMLRPSVVRSITSFAASALVVLGPSRSSLASIECWVGRSPVRRQMLVVEPRRDLASR